MNNQAFVLTNDLAPADQIAVSVSLHRHGIEAVPKTLEDGSAAYDLGNGAELAIVHVAAPYPEATRMPRGPTTPSPADLEAARAHIMIGALHLDRLVGDDLEDIDRLMAEITAGVIVTTDAVAAMLGHGVYFHDASWFTTLTVLHAEHDRVAPPIVVNVTPGQTPLGRLTLLTHGLARYGRTELLVGCTTNMDASTAFVWQMVEWLLADPDHRLVPGTVVPGDDGSSQVARAEPSPLGDGSTVVYIELGR